MYTVNSTNTIHYPNVQLVLVHCLQNWSSIDVTLYYCVVFAEIDGNLMIHNPKLTKDYGLHTGSVWR